MNKFLYVFLGLGLGYLLDNRRTGKKLIVPVTPFNISSKFGNRRDPVDPSVIKFHTGIDIAIKEGSPVKAVNRGLIKTWYDELNGYAIVIRSDTGFLYGYAHLSKVLVKNKQIVNPGDIIALSGSTGKTTGPNLHFTVTDPQGKKQDPEKYF